jgi:hypothetical protein
MKTKVVSSTTKQAFFTAPCEFCIHVRCGVHLAEEKNKIYQILELELGQEPAICTYIIYVLQIYLFTTYNPMKETYFCVFPSSWGMQVWQHVLRYGYAFPCISMHIRLCSAAQVCSPVGGGGGRSQVMGV